MKRPKKNPFPKKIGPITTVFQPQGPVRPRQPSVAAMNHKTGAPHSGLTRNRSKPSGGFGTSGPTVDVD